MSQPICEQHAPPATLPYPIWRDKAEHRHEQLHRTDATPTAPVPNQHADGDTMCTMTGYPQAKVVHRPANFFSEGRHDPGELRHFLFEKN